MRHQKKAPRHSTRILFTTIPQHRNAQLKSQLSGRKRNLRHPKEMFRSARCHRRVKKKKSNVFATTRRKKNRLQVVALEIPGRAPGGRTGKPPQKGKLIWHPILFRDLDFCCREIRHLYVVPESVFFRVKNRKNLFLLFCLLPTKGLGLRVILSGSTTTYQVPKEPLNAFLTFLQQKKGSERKKAPFDVVLN
jgi:hypothetical protein